MGSEEKEVPTPHLCAWNLVLRSAIASYRRDPLAIESSHGHRTKHIRARGIIRTTQHLESKARTKIELIADLDNISEKARISDGVYCRSHW
jgi:hypothetical protein